MNLTPLPDHYCPHMGKKLQGYIIENIFDDKLYTSVKGYIESLFGCGDTKTFGKHNTIINFENKKIKFAQSLHNNREIFLLYDTTTCVDYYYQTNNTVRDYVLGKIAEMAHPAITKAVYTMANMDVFAGDKSNYVPYRAHANWTPYEQMLSLHIDTDVSLWGTKAHYDARCFSFTIYLNSVDKGGQFWTTTGFVNNPKPNSAILINGTNIIHGVNQNRDSKKTDRMAFTVRFAHKDDLFLPGSPEKRLYSVSDYVTA